MEWHQLRSGTVAKEKREPRQAEIELASKRYDLVKWAIPIFWIAAVWIPLQAILPIARAFAGKHTSVVLNGFR